MLISVKSIESATLGDRTGLNRPSPRHSLRSGLSKRSTYRKIAIPLSRGYRSGCRHEKPTKLGETFMRSRSFARATRRFSASSICSFARRSCHAACGRERSCHPRGSLPRSLVCRAPPRSPPTSSFSPKAIRPAGTGPAPIYRLIFPNRSREIHQRRRKPAAASTSTATATQMQPLGDFVDVTVQSDQRPFNLGRTLIDDRTLELWRKLSARTFRSLDANHFGYSDPRGTIELRKAICDYLQAARGGEMRSRTDRGNGGNAAGDRHRHPDPAEPQQGGLG